MHNRFSLLNLLLQENIVINLNKMHLIKDKSLHDYIPLLCAINVCNFEIVKWLVQMGADPCVTFDPLRSPLTAIEYAKQYHDTIATDKTQAKAIYDYLASCAPKKEKSKQCLRREIVTPDNNKAFFDAFNECNIQKMQVMLDSNRAFLYEENSEGKTALILAVESNYLPIVKYCVSI